MTLRKIFDLSLVNDDTTIWIRDSDLHILARGNWHQDNILEYLDHELESFTWQDDDNFYIDVR